MNFVKIEVSKEIIASLIAGIYHTQTGIRSEAIPYTLWLGLVDELIPYLDKWDTEFIPFEEWVKYKLTVIPSILVEDLKDFNPLDNDIAYEKKIGNITYSVFADIPFKKKE